MAKHEVILHENTGALKEQAPYLGTYVTKNTTGLADIITAAAPRAGMPAIKLQTLIENDIEALMALEKSGACRIHLDGGYIELRILGSFDASDSSWNPDKNRLIIAFTPNEEIRNALVNETCTIVQSSFREEHTLALTPSATTPTKMSFAAVAAFDDIPDRTELTFVFDLGGQPAEKTTLLLDE